MLIVVLVLLSITTYSQVEPDTTKGWNLYRPQQQINQDSIDARLKFIQDSILAREQFVRDSIIRRKQILDSVTFLQNELPPLLEAIHWTTKEDIITHADKIAIIGDSALGDYHYYKLPLTLSDPYCPWKSMISLSPKNIRFTINENKKKISLIQVSAPLLKFNFTYANQGLMLIIQEDFALQNNSSGSFYKIPVDTVFYDRFKRIVKIKRYVHFYKQGPNYRKGEFIFTNLSQVKQYQYGTNNYITQYELVRFCDRYSAYQPSKVCGIIKYSIAKQGNNYAITRSNNPANEFTDGTFILAYDANKNITSISFKNLTNSRSWERFVEMNKDGNVNCYIDKSQGMKLSTMCMIYHNEPNAKYPVEIINTTYEKDGIDYFQKNVTTGKARSRNKLTMEWGPWR